MNNLNVFSEQETLEKSILYDIQKHKDKNDGRGIQSLRKLVGYYRHTKDYFKFTVRKELEEDDPFHASGVTKEIKIWLDDKDYPHYFHFDGNAILVHFIIEEHAAEFKLSLG